MPWTYAILRGNKVLARVRQDGSFDLQGGRVEIRFKPNDGKAYFASPSNLKVEPGAQVLPDDACGTADPVKKDEGGSGGSAKPKRAPTPGAVARPGDWIAYTDGACSGNPGPAGLGVIVIAPDGKIREGREYLGTATNNIAELTAVLRAIEGTPADAKGVLIHTDSQYAIGVLAKGWKAKANQQLIAEIKEALAKRPQVRLTYVPGHSGVPLNERADELAREAIAKRDSKKL